MLPVAEIIAKLRAAGPVDRGAATSGPQAAVAAMLKPSGDLFFIVRADHPHDPWSGHVAFPGGRRDPGDVDLVSVAIRETLEEVGITLTDAHLVARLPDLRASARTKRTDLTVTPFVFTVPEDTVVVANAEVATSVWVPLARLESGERASFDMTYQGETYAMPCIYLAPGNHRLWGMTLMMLDSLLDTIR